MSSSAFQTDSAIEKEFTHVILDFPNGVKVRTWQHSDIPAMARHASSKKVWDNLRNRMPNPYSESDAAFWINECHKSENHVKSGPWTRENGAEGPLVAQHYGIIINDEAVGSIGLEFKDDIYFRTAEIGYWLGEDHWGKGVMSLIVPEFVTWSWRTFGVLVRINGETVEWNKPSGKVLEKAGFQYEGRRPDYICKNGRVGASLMWGALRPKGT